MSPPCGNSECCTSGWSNCPATHVIDNHCTTVASIHATIPNRLVGSLHPFITNDFSFVFARDHFASSQQNNSTVIASTCFALLYRLSQPAVQPPLWQAVHRVDFSVPVSASAPALRRGGVEIARYFNHSLHVTADVSALVDKRACACHGFILLTLGRDIQHTSVLVVQSGVPIWFYTLWNPARNLLGF